MIYCFDTSGINWLYHDSQREPIATALLATNDVLISAVNVVEATATKDQARRTSLLNFERRLAKGTDPVALPDELLTAVCTPHARGSPRPSSPIFTRDPLITFALADACSLDEDQIQAIRNWKEDLEQDSAALFGGGRTSFQQLFSGKTVKRPPSLGKLISNHFAKDDDFLYAYMSELYRRASGIELRRDGFRQVLIDIPELCLFLMSLAQAVYARSIREHGYSARKDKNPGALDLWSTVYLTHCDCFVTSDPKQRGALRVLNALNPRPPLIQSYQMFRTRLLLE